MGKYVVLGATGGIGSELCRMLSANHDRLVLMARSHATLESLASELDCQFAAVDATSIDEVASAFESLPDEFDEIDGVVNCVGSVLLKPAHRTTEQEWTETIAKNLTSAFATVRAAHPRMKRQGGSIVLMSSAAAKIGLANHEAIAAAKAGVEGLVVSAAATYAARNIRVNAVAPGLVQTPMTESIWKNERSANASRNMHALGRLGEPLDVARLIAWLLQPENNWVTGQVFGVDGGLSSVRAAPRPN